MTTEDSVRVDDPLLMTATDSLSVRPTTDPTTITPGLSVVEFARETAQDGSLPYQVCVHGCEDAVSLTEQRIDVQVHALRCNDHRPESEPVCVQERRNASETAYLKSRGDRDVPRVRLAGAGERKILRREAGV